MKTTQRFQKPRTPKENVKEKEKKKKICYIINKEQKTKIFKRNLEITQRINTWE